MNELIRSCAGVAILITLICAPAWAQATAGINGTVRDESGAVLPGVTVTVTQTDTGITRTTISNEAGAFSLPNLPVGPYRLEASLQGFRTYAQTGVLQVGGNPVVNATLGLGAIAEDVQVTGTAALVDTRSASVGTVVESQRIVELPLNARQVTQLITLSGLAVQTGRSAGYTMNTGVRISVAGGSDFGVSYSLDGAPHLNNFDGTGLHLPFPDALQEFRLVTGAQEASGGIRAGAAVNAVTKAGTNVVHGNAFEFLRDSRFNATNALAGNDGLKRNQFGGTIGGPLMQNKAFFFVGLQATTTRQNPLDQVSFVPTAAMLAGNFSQCPTISLFGNPSRQINPATYSPAAVAAAHELPQTTDPCGLVRWGSPVHQNETQTPVRVDFQLSQAHSLFARYMLTTDHRTVPYDLSDQNPLVTTEGGSHDRAHNVTVGHTWVLSPSMVNALRVFGNDIFANKPGPVYFDAPSLGVNADTRVPGLIQLIAAGSFTIGTASFTSHTYTKIQNFGLSDDFTIVKGAHQYGIGGRYLWTKSDSVANAFSAGQYVFVGAFTGNALADFLTGQLVSLRQANPNPVQVTQPVVGAYVQDSWKASSRLTLNYGVVWNPFFSLNFYNGDIYTFDRDRFLAGETSQVMKNAPAGFFYPGDPGFNGKSGVDAHYNSWDPRAGFAWDLNGDGRSSIRGGVSLGHDYPSHQVHLNTSSASPFRLTVQQGGHLSFDDPYATFPGGNPFPYTYDPANPQFPAYATFLPVPADLKPAKQYSWNVGYQRQFSKHLFASATYIGTKLVDMLDAEEQNPPLFIPGNCEAGQYGLTAPGPCSQGSNLNQRRQLNLLRPGTQLGYITAYSDLGYQNYNGMLLNARLDLSSYWNFNANYTLSKCTSLQGADVGGGVQNPGSVPLHQDFQNNGPNDLSLDEGPCVSDRRHVVNLTSVFRTGDYSGALGALASDWTASSVIQVRTGQPLNITTGLDNALNGTTPNGQSIQRPNTVAGVDPYGNKDALVGYLNLAAFAQPAIGTLGNVSYNYLRGPNFWQWDQSFSRAFNVGGSHRIEVRAEGINITNHLNRGNPGTILNNPTTFGRITSQAIGATPRIWQFALKYDF
jgi:hypothetical protein